MRHHRPAQRPRHQGSAASVGGGSLPQRLLGVWAHPDDEAYLSAGLMAQVTERGGSVTVITATRGEKGTDEADPRFATADFAAFRELELRAALGELGVHDVRFLDLPDGDCDATDDEAASQAIADVVAAVAPDTIVTFGPDGITNHPDHRAVSRWTTEAWRRVGGADLLYATYTPEHLERFASLHAEIGVFEDFGAGAPPATDPADLALACSLEGAELDRKRRALGAHASQTTGLAELLGEGTYRRWIQAEYFRRPSRDEIACCTVADRIIARSLVGSPS